MERNSSAQISFDDAYLWRSSPATTWPELCCSRSKQWLPISS